MRNLRFLVPYLMTTVLVILAVYRTSEAKSVEWPSYGADQANSKFSPLGEINRDNVTDLQTAWRWSSPDNRIVQENPELWTWANEATPIMVGGVLYTSTAMSQVAAIDAATGKTVWVYDPESYRAGSPPGLGFVHRGVAYWQDGDDRRVFIGTGDARLIAIDADTGKPIPSFGDNGTIDLTQGLRRPASNEFLAVTSPPIVVRDVLIVGSLVSDRTPKGIRPPGDVRGFDVRTGEPRWTFHTIPQEEEFGVETWKNDSWKTTGSTNVWTIMSADEALGYVYLPISTPTNDFYGGQRLGDNLFAESLVALDVETGERVWHFQMVHHGIWDYDLPAAPNLIDIVVDGKPIKAVAQISKQAFIYVFDRVTGEPVWPIEERPVPASTVPGEQTSPTQPFPTRPLPFDRQGFTVDDVIDFTPELRERALDLLSAYQLGPLFTPPSEAGTVTMPGVAGGANWAGASVNPETGILYVPSVTMPSVLSVTKSEPDSLYSYTGTFLHPSTLRQGLTAFMEGPDGLPITKPPYARVTAVDLNTGEHLWMQPIGDGLKDHPALRDLDLPRLGYPARVFTLATTSLLFVVQQGEGAIRGASPRGNALEVTTERIDPSLWAFDLRDGTLIAKVPLPGNAWGAPMTYLAQGRQYIVIPIGGASYPAELVALSLP